MNYINPKPIPPSEKQLKLIKEMEAHGIYKFEGKTIEAASTYIANNMETFKEQKQFLS